MAPCRAISMGRGFARGARRPRAVEVPAQLEMVVVVYLRAPVDRHNHFGHDMTHDPELSYVFDGNAPLFLEGSSQESNETIRTSNYRTLQEIITDAKFSVPHKDVLGKPHFLFGDSVPGGNSLFYRREKY
ncbi:uncharacterized protein A4U43_C03F24890 [Asparagus officinalis]|uniref:Uncharacterized protein n=1 Tax=Asparagus officinalis TaxID=4686 RepID=A0A5P1FHX7_ASPOF|nr:uncharacterized protein A4U43_C03F24890 [Asparagus officinalis]